MPKTRIGLGLANLPFSSPKAFWRFVDLCEDGDVDSLWQTDRLVSPLPQLEVMSTMAALAGGTSRLKFGMNVTVVPFRDATVLAPEWQALGWNRSDRGARTDEALDIMARLWRGERVSVDGAHHRYTDVAIAPLPVQQPLPLWIGGRSAAAIRRTAAYGTGWLGGVESPEQVAPVIARIREAAAAAGRPIDEDHYGAAFGFRFGDWDEPIVQMTTRVLTRLAKTSDPRRHAVAGDADAMVARIDEFRAVGVSKFVLRPIAHGDDDVLEQTRRLIAEVLPRVHAERAAQSERPR